MCELVESWNEKPHRLEASGGAVCAEQGGVLPIWEGIGSVVQRVVNELIVSQR